MVSLNEEVIDTLSPVRTEVTALPPTLYASVAVGAVASINIALFIPSESEAPGEGNVRVAVLVALSWIVPLFTESESVPL